METSDLRIRHIKPLLPPAILLEELPINKKISNLVVKSRREIVKIMRGEDDRLLVIVGPCSVHDPKSAIDYAKKLLNYAKKSKNELLVVMRVYFEKPRTTIGWKGLINDPNLDGSFAINKGLRVARKLLLEINDLGMPCGVEFLDVIIPQFIGDIVSWGAIGARTTESQVHRELSSGLSAPIGFKNGTGGSVRLAIDAILAASKAHHFLSVTHQGLAAIVATAGNNDCHLILRGSTRGANYDEASVSEACALLAKANLPQHLMVDCSHGNSQKNPDKQIESAEDICQQISSGSRVISSVMLESFIKRGAQSLRDPEKLIYGQSITDACMSWEQTEGVLDKLRLAALERRAKIS